MKKMRVLASVLLAMLGGFLSPVAAQQIDIIPPLLTTGSQIPSPLAGDLELRDPAQLAAESLTNGALTAGTSWIANPDCVLASNAVTCTHAGVGNGIFYQPSVNAAIPFASTGINGWFRFVYTTSAVTGSYSCVIGSAAGEFVGVSVPLTIDPAGTYTKDFQADSDTLTNFVVRCTSSGASTVTFDNLSLKQISGGGLKVHGRVGISAGTGALPALFFIREPSLGIFTPSLSQIGVAIGGSERVRFAAVASGGAVGILSAGNASASYAFYSSLSSSTIASGIYEKAVNTPAVTVGASTVGTNLATLGGVFCVNTTSQATTGTIEEVLATCTLPANALSANGKGVRIRAWADGTGAGSKDINLRFGGIGGTVIANMVANAGTGVYHAHADVFRTGASTQISFGNAYLNNMLGGTAPTSATPNQTDTATIAIVVTGITAVAGELTFKLMTVEFFN